MKTQTRKFGALVFSAAIAAGAVVVTSASEQGLVAHFAFDDSTRFGYDSVRQMEIGGVTNDQFASQAAIDASSCDGVIVRGMQFASGYCQNHYMKVPGASFGSGYGIPCGNQDITYSIWINPTTTWSSSTALTGLGTALPLLARPGGANLWADNNHLAIWILKGDNNCPKIVFASGSGYGASSSAIYQSPTMFDGSWHFITATYSNRKLTLYYDATNKVEKALSANVNVGDNTTLWLGWALESGKKADQLPANCCCGKFDDLKVYNRALGDDEVLAAFNAGATAYDTDVIAWDGASGGGAVENGGNWSTRSNRRTAEEIYAAGPVMDLTDVNNGGTITHNANSTLKLKGAICTNGQDEVTLRMQSGTLAMKRPSTQRGLVAHFSFDDPSQVTFDSGSAELTATTNISTYGSTTEAVPVRTTDGVTGNAMYFPENGTWGYYASPYMKTEAATTTKANGIPAGNEAVSYSIWIKPLATGRFDNGMYGLSQDFIWLFRRGTWNNGNASYLWLSKGSGSGKLWWSIANYVESDGTCSYEPSNLFDGNWHHVVCTYESQTLALYYDGVKVATATASYPLSVADGSSISLGYSSTPSASSDTYHRYLGGFDEFKIFNVALTDAEVATEYAQHSRTLDSSSAGTVPSPVGIQLDMGTSMHVLGYGHEYGSLAGLGSVSVGPASELRLDGMFALSGTLAGCGSVTVANLTLGSGTSAYTGDFTVGENALIVASDDNGNVFNSSFGGKVFLPKKAVIQWGANCPRSGVATITAASFALPSDFSEWKTQTGRDMKVTVANGTTLRMRKLTNIVVSFR